MTEQHTEEYIRALRRNERTPSPYHTGITEQDTVELFKVHRQRIEALERRCKDLEDTLDLALAQLAQKYEGEARRELREARFSWRRNNYAD